jgi:pilus assembly protein CpaF
VETQLPTWLLELIDNEHVTDILLSESQSLVDYGDGLVQLNDFQVSESELSAIARELIELGGRRLDLANPFADVCLPGGLRVHAVLKSGCSSKTLLSIRLHQGQSNNTFRIVQLTFSIAFAAKDYSRHCGLR